MNEVADACGCYFSSFQQIQTYLIPYNSILCLQLYPLEQLSASSTHGHHEKSIYTIYARNKAYGIDHIRNTPTAANATPATSNPSLGHVVAPALKPTTEDDGDPPYSVLVGEGQLGGPVPTMCFISDWSTCLMLRLYSLGPYPCDELSGVR